MAKHYGLNRLIDYNIEDVDDTIKVVNPDHRKLQSEIKKLGGLLGRRKNEFATIALDCDIGDKNFNAKQIEKSKILEEIDEITKLIAEKKEKQKATVKHILISELPEDLRFKALSSNSKHFIDTIKMIAYRAETATVSILKESISDYGKDEARSLMRAIYQSPADLIVDKEKNTLTIKLHSLANRSSDRSVEYLCEELNATEMIYPETNLKLVYQLLTSKSEPIETGNEIKAFILPSIEKGEILTIDVLDKCLEKVNEVIMKPHEQILFEFMED